MEGEYQYSGERRAELESLVIPLAVYQYINQKVKVLIISDGLCKLFGESRALLTERFDHDMYRNVHPDDVETAAKAAYRFATESDEYNISYREKLNGSDEYSILHARGEHFYTEIGQRLAIVWYEDITYNETVRKEVMKKINRPVRDFFDQNFGAMAVVSVDGLKLLYYNKAIEKLLVPQKAYDVSYSFSEFFFDGDEKIDELFDGADTGVQYFYSQKNACEIEVNIITTTWDGNDAYLIYLNDFKNSKTESLSLDDLYKQTSLFQNTLSGIENNIPFLEFGYKGYMVWNLSKNKVVYASAADAAFMKFGGDFDYDQYYQIYLNRMENEWDVRSFENLSPENLRREFFRGRQVPSQTFGFSTPRGTIYLKITPNIMQAPDSGELYLRLQAENVTDDIVFDHMLLSAVKEVTDFVAYLDGKSKLVYYIDNTEGHQDTGEHKKSSIDNLAWVFSKTFDREFRSSEDVLDYIDMKCGDNAQISYTNKVSADCILSVNIQIINRKNEQYFLTAKDITRLARMEGGRYTDELTGLSTVTAFRTKAQIVREELKNSNKTPAFIYFDIRDMKAINESFGFSNGDAILVHTAHSLCTVFRNEPIARIAEDHFVVLSDRQRIEQKLEIVYDSVFNNPTSIQTQICAGIYIDDDKQKIDVLAASERARLACKSLKGDYKHKYKTFDRSMFDEYHQRQHVLMHFDDALKNGWIRLYYQPIIRTSTGNICDMEALCRWVDPEKGMLSPSQFIPVLEEHRLITKLDFYMIRKICENLYQRKKQKLPLVPISVNLSRVDFEECNVVENILKIVDEYHVSHKLLTIEITESAFSNNQQFLVNQIRRFREVGFKVWMDDFGSEYSSLNTLQEFDFDLIKLDMKFMKNFSLIGKSHAILSDIVSMVSRLGIHTLAEGVETKEQLDFLSDIGCEKAQGYLFSRPMPCEYFIEKDLSTEDLPYDDFRMAAYYDKIGAINFNDFILMELDDRANNNISGVPAAVLEYKDGEFSVMKHNAAYDSFLDMLGLEDKTGTKKIRFNKQPSQTFKMTAEKCIKSNRWESITDDNECGVIVSSRLFCIGYDSRSKVAALLVIVNRTYLNNIENDYSENEYHFNRNLLLMASKGLSGLLGYRSIYDFLAVTCYMKVNLTLNEIEEVHLGEDDKNYFGQYEFDTYDGFVQYDLSHQPEEVVTDDQRAFFDRITLIKRFIDGKNTLEIEYLRDYHGVRRWKHTICRMTQSNSEVHAWFFMYDINDYVITNQEIRNKAERDGLTGLLNQATAVDTIDAYLKQHPTESSAVVMMDIDNFKRYNDRYGHKFGDFVICRMAEILSDVFEDNCIVGRVGGDEFMVLIKNCTAEEAAKRISPLQENELIAERDGIKEKFTTSVGYAMFPKQGSTYQELYRRADMAMYAVKTDGKAKFKQFRGEMEHHPN